MTSRDSSLGYNVGLRYANHSCNTFAKVQYPFMIKTISKIGADGNFPNKTVAI
jgi:hypothetical protein